MKRTDIKKILIIGSGPIVIGQAAEFDYAGTQACLALREEGYEVPDTGRSEYETTGGFGSMVGCSDPLTVNLCNTWCNEYGLDTISASGTVAWAVECCEAGTLTADDLASAAGVSQTALQEAFHKAFGMSAVQYIRSVKMREAKRLTDAGELSVKEIAARTGFSSVSYFSRTYSGFYGCAPSRNAGGGAARQT